MKRADGAGMVAEQIDAWVVRLKDQGGARRSYRRLGYLQYTPQEKTMQDPVIRSVTLRVQDAARSRAFYEDVLGLETADGRAFSAPGEREPLVHLIEAPNARPKPQRALGLYHFAILVPSRAGLGAVLQRLVEGGRRLQGTSDHRVSEALYLADPDGHGIEIYRDRPTGEWTYTESGELYMTTDPLDLQDLASTAPRPAGVPEGTVIGHIHLHVSNLQEAEAFYVEDLGFDVMVRSYPGALFLSTAGYHHHIGLNTWAGPSAAPPDDVTIGMERFALRAPAVENRTLEDPDGIRIDVQ